MAAEQSGNRVPTYPTTQSPKSQSDDAKNACDDKSGIVDLGGLKTFSGADGGAPEWESHPGKEESFNIDTNSLKWPNTETARTAKR